MRALLKQEDIILQLLSLDDQPNSCYYCLIYSPLLINKVSS